MTDKQGKLFDKKFDFSNAKGPSNNPNVGSFTKKLSKNSNSVSDHSIKGLARDSDNEFSVSELVGRIKSSLATTFPKSFKVTGEIVNLRPSGAGHYYFNLKDDRSSMDCVMWQSRRKSISFEPSDGMKVVATAQIDIYEVRGRLQLQITGMSLQGQGNLELQFRLLKDKLQNEGLFNPEIKKAIPQFPRAIGIVSSKTGAAIRDIQKTLSLRWPISKVYLLHAPVQGQTACDKLAQAIMLMDKNAEKLEIDTIILSRGGGSLEDLWPFNEEVLARAIFQCKIPVISGIGHEIDFTISDFAADYRAATPTAAAEAATPDSTDIINQLASSEDALRNNAFRKLEISKQILDGIYRTAIFRDPLSKTHTEMRRIDEITTRLTTVIETRLATTSNYIANKASELLQLHPGRMVEQARNKLNLSYQGLRWALGSRAKREADRLVKFESVLEKNHPSHQITLAKQKLEAAARQLEAVSYKNTLARGFSVTRTETGDLVESVKTAAKAKKIIIEFHDGKIKTSPDPIIEDNTE